jgi:formylglycine-generating enzyme required for sulfatase activity
MARASGVTAESAPRHAWTDADADVRTHRCGEKPADRAGLVDLWGNAAEWCTDGQGKFFVMGGSYRDEKVDPAAMKPVPETPEWNDSDPQFPKSVWWLVDGPFIGMRVVTSDGPKEASK